MMSPCRPSWSAGRRRRPFRHMGLLAAMRLRIWQDRVRQHARVVDPRIPARDLTTVHPGHFTWSDQAPDPALRRPGDLDPCNPIIATFTPAGRINTARPPRGPDAAIERERHHRCAQPPGHRPAWPPACWNWAVNMASRTASPTLSAMTLSRSGMTASSGAPRRPSPA